MSAPSIALYYPFAGVWPVAQTVSATGTEVTIRFEAEEGAWPACSNCCQVSFDVHSYGRRRVRDLDMAQLKVWLEIPQRKVRCESCGVRVEGLEFVEPSRRFTRRFERAVADLCRVLPIKHVAAHFGLSWVSVRPSHGMGKVRR